MKNFTSTLAQAGLCLAVALVSGMVFAPPAQKVQLIEAKVSQPTPGRLASAWVTEHPQVLTTSEALEITSNDLASGILVGFREGLEKRGITNKVPTEFVTWVHGVMAPRLLYAMDAEWKRDGNLATWEDRCLAVMRQGDTSEVMADKFRQVIAARK